MLAFKKELLSMRLRGEYVFGICNHILGTLHEVSETPTAP